MDATEARIRYLESVQRIIDRLSNISIVLKGWAVTLTAALLTLSLKESDIGFAVLVYFPIVFFWLIDAEYLKMERQYKVLYNENAILDVPITSFKIKRPKASFRQHTTFAQCFFSRTELLVYIPMILSILFIMVVNKP